MATVTAMPRSSNAAPTALVEPPAPRIKAGPAAGSTRWARRFSKNPQPSVLLPLMRPFWNTMVFTAPARRADASTVSQTAKAARLCGMVTLTPANPAAISPWIAAGNRAGSIGSGT